MAVMAHKRRSYALIMNASDRKRFEAKFTKTDGCWIWRAGLSVYGYGWFRPHGVMQCCNAHRVSFELYVGVIPSNLTVDHLCQVKACVNPSHLELVSRAENSRRGCPSKPGCERGHQWTTENTFIASNGARICKQCYKIRTGWNLWSSGPGVQK